MNRYSARDLLAMEEAALWALPEERHVVVFDDGEIETHTRATIISVYFWYPLTFYPEVSLLKDFHLGKGRLSGGSILDRMNRVAWHIHQQLGEPADTETLAHQVFKTNNRLYNAIITNLGRYVTTMSLIDALQVMEHPDIKKANAAVQPNTASIAKTYEVIKKTLLTSDDLIGNPIAESLRSGTIKMGQALQCFGPLGDRTDVNSDIFRAPITRGLLEGVPGLYGNLIESRSGSKALAFNKELIRDTEYFNRKLQMVAAYIQRLHHGDCGTSYSIQFPVMREMFKTLVGKYYYAKQEDGSVVLDWITKDHTHLIGQTIQLRSVLGCTHPDPQGVCSTCYGRIAFSIPKDTNIGQVSAVDTGDKITSAVLSTKHQDSIGGVDKFQLGQVESKYLQYRGMDEVIFLKKKWMGRKLIVTIHHTEAKNLADILMVRKINLYPIRSASQITQILFSIADCDEPIRDMLTVSLHNRKASFSHAMLQYLVKKRWTHDDSGNIVIDMSDFDPEKPFLVMPMKHVHMHEVMKRIGTFIQSKSDDKGIKLDKSSQANINGKRFLTEYRNHTEALIHFNQLINEKLYVNLVHSEMLLFAMTARDKDNGDYTFPKPAIKGRFARYNELMENRSLGGLMALEKQQAAVTHPRLFLNQNRPDHPYDVMLMGGVKTS